MQGNQDSIDWNLLQNVIINNNNNGQVTKLQDTPHTQIDSGAQIPQNPKDLQQMLNQFFEATKESKESDACVYMREKQGVFQTEQVGGQWQQISEQRDYMIQSSKGNYMILANPNLLELVENQSILSTFHFFNLQLVEFSSNEAFIIAVDKVDQVSRLIILLNPSLELVFSSPLGRFSKGLWPLIQMDSTCSLCFLYMQKEVQIYETAKFRLLKTIPNMPSPGNFSLSIARDSLYFSVIELRQTLQYPAPPSSLSIYHYDSGQIVLDDSLPGAQDAKQLWSPDGQALLLWCQLLNDETNQSYEGVHKIYHFNTKTKQLSNISRFNGPVHDLAWSPDSKHFIMVSGFMPSGSVLYNKEGVQLYLLNQHHVNVINWSPCSQYVCLSGFGNLPGDIEIWNLPTLKQVGKCKKDKVVTFQWSPCSNYFLTATTFPRLRVCNGYQIFERGCKQIYSQEFTELYDIKWHPKLKPIQLAKNLKTLEPPIPVQQQTHKKTLSINKTSKQILICKDFIKEMKGEIDQSKFPIKLLPDTNLMDFVKVVEKVVLEPTNKRKISCDEPPQPQPKQTILRRQAPAPLPQTEQQATQQMSIV